MPEPASWVGAAQIGKRRKTAARGAQPQSGSERYRIEVGHLHGVKPGNIVGAIANESGLDGSHIGQIEIEADFSLVDLPAGMPHEVFMDLKKVRVCGQPMNISLLGAAMAPRKRKGRPNPKGKPKVKGKAKSKTRKRTAK